MTFTPGSDEGRTDTFDAQTATPDRDIDKRVEEDFEEAQSGIRFAGDALYNFAKGVLFITTGGSVQSTQALDALRAKIEGKPFIPPSPNPNAPGIVNLEPITTEDAFTQPDMTGTGQQPEIEDVPQYPVVVQRILKVKKDNPGFFSNIINSIGKDNTQDDDDFGPEGPRGSATDEQIMQAYRERTGELDLDPNRVENRENRTGTNSLTGPNPNLLNMVQSPSGSGPVGKITYRNIPNLDRFLSGQTTSLDRTTAGLIQNPNFKLGDFLQGIDQELERVRRQYPNIDVDTNLQRFKWQWHHINPDKMPVDFYVGLNNVNDRDLITDTLLRETNVSAGMNPSNRIGLPTEVHDEITDWLDTEIGKRSEVITQKISDDLGYGLTLTGRGSRAAKLQFNQRFANEPVQTRIPYIIEYGQKIAESTQILDELMNQFDIFYDIPNGYRLDIDVNTMERMLARLDEGKPTIRTFREIIEEVTDGMRIPVSDDLGRQGIAEPRDPNLIRAIDIEGMLRDHKNKQSVLDNKQIRSLQKELNEIYQMDLDIKGASTSAYIQAWYNERFGGDRRTGPKTGPN
tara:strand:+ start:14 stop:1726 length:1713 start_codon:yes stop_codon:yes gene_type:complete